MRRISIAAAFLSVAMVSGILGAIAGISTASSVYPKGDMNCDSLVNLSDALDIVKFKAGLTTGDIPNSCDAVGSLPGSPSSPPTSPSGSTFGDGTWLVGSDVQPGLYRNSSSAGGCYWARLSGVGGTPDEILANNFTNSTNTVQIKADDVAFKSDGCNTWSQNLTPPSSGSDQPFGDGQWLVTEEVAAGTWRNSDSSGGCLWARLSGFSGNLSDTITNGFSMAIQTVQVSAGDAGFASAGCGTWTKIG